MLEKKKGQKRKVDVWAELVVRRYPCFCVTNRSEARAVVTSGRG